MLDICHALEPHLRELGNDQLIDESGGGVRWVHVSRAIPPSNTTPRYQCLTIVDGVATTGFGNRQVQADLFASEARFDRLVSVASKYRRLT